MRVGTLCYATQSGLGILAKSFFDHGVVTDFLLVKHPHYQNFPDWYPQDRRYERRDHRRFLRTIDVLLIFENGFYPEIVQVARAMGKRIVVMPMYEYTPVPFPVSVDLFLCPSLLDLQYYRKFYHCIRSEFIPVPVAKPWKLRERALHFVHNAGHGGVKNRNGTPELLEALQYVNSPIQLTVRGQPTLPTRYKDEDRVQRLFENCRKDPRLNFVLGNVPDDELWSTGDVFIFPEKFNGLSLPLQEAYASGMLVMGSYRFPMDAWLPREPLIPVEKYCEDRLSISFLRAVIRPETIAQAIDHWYGQDITEYSLQGKLWAEENSWEVLKPQYLAALKGELL